MKSKLQLRRNNLVNLYIQTAKSYYAQEDGEDFHEDYQKYDTIFRKIVRSDMKLNREMKKYLVDFSDRILDLVDWTMYENRKASLLDMIVADWKDETLLLKVVLTESLLDAISAGGELTELDTNIDIGWSEKEPAAIRFLNGYSLKLAGKLTSTTKDVIKETIKDGIKSGLTQADLAKNLQSSINNPVRARMIAHTESIRAFSAGRLEVARQIGAEGVEWSATLNACPICSPMDGQVVKLGKAFSSGHLAPPAHPNCRCIVRIVMPKDGKPKQNDTDVLQVFEDFFKN